jgi:hypothetical protein
MEALIADAEQATERGESSISQIVTPAILANAFTALVPTLEEIAF